MVTLQGQIQLILLSSQAEFACGGHKLPKLDCAMCSFEDNQERNATTFSNLKLEIPL